MMMGKSLRCHAGQRQAEISLRMVCNSYRVIGSTVYTGASALS